LFAVLGTAFHFGGSLSLPRNSGGFDVFPLVAADNHHRARRCFADAQQHRSHRGGTQSFHCAE
jgi:hypothetical protein